MSLNIEILKILENSRGHFFSGQELAEKLNVSRQAVWKGIKSLQSDGHLISAKTNSGYALESDSDVISASEIQKFLRFSSFEIIVKKSIDSTNLEAKRLLANGKNNNFLVISEEQTHGLGRSGKSFFSPKNSIYMSIALNLQGQNESSQLLTCATAVAVCESMEKFVDITPKIKWVNDILVENKKVCGILTEGILDFETAQIKNVVIGIGINCNQSQSVFPHNLQSIAQSITLTIPRNLLIAEITNNVCKNVYEFDKSIMEKYRQKSMMLGKTITYTHGTQNVTALVKNIDDSGHLQVVNDDGTENVISSGIVEIKGLYE